MKNFKNLSYEEYKKMREKQEKKYFKKKHSYRFLGKLFNLKYKGQNEK